MNEMDGNNMFLSDDEMMIMIERMHALFSEFQYSDLYSKAISSDEDFELCKHKCVCNPLPTCLCLTRVILRIIFFLGLMMRFSHFKVDKLKSSTLSVL